MSDDLRALFDKAALTELIARYAQTIDARDVEGVAACFTPDAEVAFNGGAQVVHGRDELSRFLETGFAGELLSGPSTHLLGDIVVSLDGDAAHLETQGVAYLASDVTEMVVIRGLRYSDDCVRQDGRWLIERRTHRGIWQTEAPRAALL